MLWEPTLRIQAAVEGYTPLTDWISATYPGDSLKVLVGTTVPTKASDYPFVAIAAAEESRRGDVPRRHQEVAIAYGLHQSAITDGSADGVAELAAMGEHILAALLADEQFGAPGSMQLEPDTQSYTDLMARHPLYRAELGISVLVAADGSGSPIRVVLDQPAPLPADAGVGTLVGTLRVIDSVDNGYAPTLLAQQYPGTFVVVGDRHELRVAATDSLRTLQDQFIVAGAAQTTLRSVINVSVTDQQGSGQWSPESAGCLHWLDAHSVTQDQTGLVYEIADKVTGAVYTQPVPSSQPLSRASPSGVGDILRFDGLNDYYLLDIAIPAAAEVCIIASPWAGKPYCAPLRADESRGGSIGFLGHYSTGTQAGWHQWEWYPASPPGPGITTASPAEVGVFRVVSAATTDGGLRTALVNGTDITSNPSASGVWGAGLVLGARCLGSGALAQFAATDFAALLIFPPLSVGDRASLLAWATAKYGVTL